MTYEQALRTQTILKLIANCLEFSRKWHERNGQTMPTSGGMANGTTNQTNGEQVSRIDENNDTTLKETLDAFEFLLEYFFEFYVWKGSNLKFMIELNGRKYLTFNDLNCISIEDGSILKGNAKDSYGTLDQSSLLAVLFDLVVAGMDHGIYQSSLKDKEDNLQPLNVVNGIEAKTGKSSRKKKKNNTQQYSKKFATIKEADSVSILNHFPPMPPEHSYLSTKLTLHPLEDDVELREKKVNLESTMDRNLKKMASLQLKAAKKKPEDPSTNNAAIESALDYFGFGFVNSALRG